MYIYSIDTPQPTRTRTMFYVLAAIVVFLALIVRANILHTPVSGYSE